MRVRKSDNHTPTATLASLSQLLLTLCVWYIMSLLF